MPKPKATKGVKTKKAVKPKAKPRDTSMLMEVDYKSKGKLRVKGWGMIEAFKKGVQCLTAKTQKNLEAVAAKLKIDWTKIYSFEVSQNPRSMFAGGCPVCGTGVKPREKVLRWSRLIVGIGKDGNIYEYFRKETESPGAGQTLVYVNGSNPKQIIDIL